MSSKVGEVLADREQGVTVSVDYRLLHHFRVSQRREMASRGEVPTLRPAEGKLPAARDVTPAELPVTRPARIQVLTHLLNEDR
jgi:hypothetical protein